MEDQQGSLQLVAGVVGGRGEQDFRDHLPKRGEVQRDRLGEIVRGEGRKIILREAHDPEAGLGTADLDPILVLHLESDLILRQEPGDFEDFLGGERDGTGPGDLGLGERSDSHLQIRRHQLQLVLVRRQVGVGQDGNRVLLLNDTLEALQLPEKILPLDGEFHGDSFCRTRALLPLGKT